MDTIGSRLAYTRNLVGISQKDLAKQTDFTASALCNIENSVSYPSVGFLIKLSEIISVDMNWLLFGIGFPKIRMQSKGESALYQQEVPAHQSVAEDISIYVSETNLRNNINESFIGGNVTQHVAETATTKELLIIIEKYQQENKVLKTENTKLKVALQALIS